MASNLRALALTWGNSVLRCVEGTAAVESKRLSFAARRERHAYEVVPALLGGESRYDVMVLLPADGLPMGAVSKLEVRSVPGVRLLQIETLTGLPMPAMREAAVISNPVGAMLLIEEPWLEWRPMSDGLRRLVEGESAIAMVRIPGLAILSALIDGKLVCAVGITTEAIRREHIPTASVAVLFEPGDEQPAQ